MDWWIAPAVLNGDDAVLRLRARILATLLLTLSGVALAFVVFDLVSGLFLLAAPLAIGMLCVFGALYELRRTGNVSRVGVFCAAILGLVVLGNAVFNGGLDAPVLGFLVVPAMLLLIMTGPRASLLGVGASGAVVVLVFLAEAVGMVFPQTMPADQIPLNRALVLVALIGTTYGAFRLSFDLADWLQARLAEAQAQRTARILDAAGDAILVVSEGGRIRHANAAASVLFGRRDLTEVPVQTVLPDARPSDVPGESVLLEAVDVNGTVPVEVTMTRLATDHVFVVRDVRERLQAQRALEAARDQATEASQAKSRFLASMSHELRTPLNAIVGYAELMIDDISAGQPVGSIEDLDRVVTSAQHLRGLIDQVLDLAKVESGQLELEWRTVPISALLEELEPIGQSLAERNRNTWTIDAEVGSTPIETDPLRFKQVGLNLLSNAAKFTTDGAIRLSARVVGPHLEVVVEDSGIGMTPEQQERVWDVFVQAESSTTRRFGGTGLGLPLARQLAEALGATLALHSEAGEGTRMVLTAPLTRTQNTP